MADRLDESVEMDHIEEELVALTGPWIKERRHLLWVKMFLGLPKEASSFQLVNQLKFAVNAKCVVNQYESGILGDDCFDWIGEDSKRDVFYVVNYLRSNYCNSVSQVPLSVSVYYSKDYIASFVNCLFGGYSDRLFVVSSVRNMLSFFKLNDHAYRWFDGRDSARKIEYAYSWLKSKNMLVFCSGHIVSKDDLMLLFCRQNLDINAIENRIEKIKRGWAQKKFREKDDRKKQVNINITKSSDKFLDDMAVAFNISKSQVVENLIRGEMQQIKMRTGTFKGYLQYFRDAVNMIETHGEDGSM